MVIWDFKYAYSNDTITIFRVVRLKDLCSHRNGAQEEIVFYQI